MKFYLKRLILLFVYFLYGCATPPPNIDATSQSDVDCLHTDRHPDSQSCSSLFQDSRVILNKKIIDSVPEFFDSLEKEYAEEMRKPSDHFHVRVLNDYTVNTLNERMHTDLRVNIAARLYEEAALGSPAGKIYQRLGYKVDEVNDPTYVGPQKNKSKIKVLRPPLDLARLYQRIYELILGTKSTLLEDSQIILPALIFFKYELGKPIYRLVRPGIDPIPLKSDGWNIPNKWVSTQLDTTTFALNVSRGMIPLECMMYNHDLAHIVDYILNPQLAALHRKFFSMQHTWQTTPSLRSAYRETGNYLNEFLMFPNLSQKNLFKKIIKPRSYSEERRTTLLNEFYSGQLEKRMQFLEENFFKLFDLHGGGALDGRSKDVFANIDSLLRNRIFQKGHSVKPHPASDIYHFLIEDSYWGLVKQMSIIRALLRNDLPTLRSFGTEYDTLINHPNPNFRMYLTDALLDLMEKFEFKVERALSAEMSAEQLFSDITGPKNFTTSKSYRFFKETAIAGSLEYLLFVKQMYFGK